MPDNVVASVPLGWILALAFLIGGLGAFGGWQVAAGRARRKAGAAQRAVAGHAAALLNSLPQAALLVDSDGILAQNEAAAPILQEFEQPGELPPAAAQAVRRAVQTGMAETIAVPLPNSPARQLNILIAPLSGGRAEGEIHGKVLALILSSETPLPPGLFSRPLARNLAHELRTPLTAILGHVEIMNSCEISEEALWRRSLGFVSSETERLARLVEDMLYLARLERAPIDLQPVDLRRIAEEALAVLREQATQNQVAVSLQAAPDLPRAHADPDRMRQVFTNLLDNTLKYAPGCTATIHLSAEPGRVKVEFHDSGPGVSAEDLPFIFEPFYRSHQSAARKHGSGLGLAIVRTILEQHHAPIQAASQPGEGTRFTFSLPAELLPLTV